MIKVYDAVPQTRDDLLHTHHDDDDVIYIIM